MTVAPDRFGTVVGWRFWVIQPTPGDTVLNSPMFPMKWPPLEVVAAVCANRRRERRRPWRTHPIEHDCPNPGCNCGIHAATSPTGLASFLRPSLAADRGDVRVVGQVELWGMIVEGPAGWRGAAAYPAELWLPQRSARSDRERWSEICSGLRAYGVPVHAEAAPTMG